MDSNAVENTIRPIALGRKNVLFAGHDEGGKNWGLFASLIGTCKLNDVNPFDYLKSTLEALANGHPQSRLDDLMPWAFIRQAEKPMVPAHRDPSIWLGAQWRNGCCSGTEGATERRNSAARQDKDWNLYGT